MPTPKRKPAKPASRKTASRKATSRPSKKASSGHKNDIAMSDSQRTIYNKLRRKGMAEATATAFSKHAARRKDAAAARKAKATSTKATSTRRTAKRK